MLNRTLTLIAISCISLLTAGHTLAAGDPAAGKEKAAVCAACHGPDGNSTMAPVPGLVVPNIAGQYADYLAKSLQDYRSGARKNANMNAQAAALSDQDIENLAAFYASQTGLYVVKDPNIK